MSWGQAGKMVLWSLSSVLLPWFLLHNPVAKPLSKSATLLVGTKSRGFTLIELMLVVALTGVLSSLAIGFSGEWRRRQEFNKLTRSVFSSLSYARSLALERGERVSVWFDDAGKEIHVFVDADNDLIYDATETRLSVFPNPANTGLFRDVFDADMSLTAPAFVAAHGVTTAVFDYQGFSIASNGDALAGSVSLNDVRLGVTSTVDVTIAGAIRVQ